MGSFPNGQDFKQHIWLFILVHWRNCTDLWTVADSLELFGDLKRRGFKDVIRDSEEEMCLIKLSGRAEYEDAFVY